MPSTATSRPLSPAISQTAFSRRSSEVIGSRTPVAGLNLVKSGFRCCNGLVPVIMVVQMSGEILGSNERRTPARPSRTSRARLGIVPSAQ